MVAEPNDAAIRVYRSAGFTDRETQVSMQHAASQT